MKYFIIAGEASGDIHAAQLIKSLKSIDFEAEIKFLGGDLMMEASGEKPIIHYKKMAYMGFVEVIKHLPEISKIMKIAKDVVRDWHPDAVILIDYPSFNLKIAKYSFELGIPAFYYISPKVWAWKEYRVKEIKKYITALYSILPFEPKFFQDRHNFKVDYVGNPSVNEMSEAMKKVPSFEDFCSLHSLDCKKPIISILAGSRKKEIRNNLPEMLKGVEPFSDFQIVISGAPNISIDFYENVIKESGYVKKAAIVENDTFSLVKNSRASLVTSGTATLETALIGTPQIVCYRMNGDKIIYKFFARLLKVKYVSLPNLIADDMIVPELLVNFCNRDNIINHLAPLINDSQERMTMLNGYQKMMQILGSKDSADTAARDIIKRIKISN